MDKIILVGNSSSVLQHELGSVIDSYDYIVRFNNFKIKGYEKNVGSRTDCICLRSCSDVTLVDSNELRNVYTFVTYCIHKQGMKHVALHHKAFFGKKCTIVDEVRCFDYAAKIGLRNDMTEWPSIGALAISMFVEMYGKDKITLHGFTSDGKSHYFPKPNIDSKYHNWAKEAEFISGLNLKTLA